jgi:inosine-uridine nucleoside N-ribohydrolase
MASHSTATIPMIVDVDTGINAALALLYLLRTTPVAVQVEVDGPHTTGQTVTDWRGLWEREPNVDVADGVESEAFLDRSGERLFGLVSASA